jgi:hypothetical protein
VLLRIARFLLLAAAAAGILVATLRSGGSTLPAGWSFDIASGEAAVAEAIQNLLLFIPLGIALPLCGVRALPALGMGAALSFIVEFLQESIPGRDPSVGDIICNTISTGIGIVAVLRAPRWLTVPPQRSASQAIATAAVASIVWLATGLLLRPAVPPPPYREVSMPNFPFWGRYRGKVLEATLSPFPLSTPLRITAVASDRPPGRAAPLVAILDARDTKVLVVAVDGRDLAIRYHTPAGSLTLEQPDLRWRDALRGVAPRDTFAVRAWRDESGTCLALDAMQRCGLGYTIGDGWKLIFYPERWPGWTLALLNTLWVAGCLLGAGYWTGRAGERRSLYMPIALAAAGLLIIPLMTGLQATPILEWIGAVGGFMVGFGLARASRAT